VTQRSELGSCPRVAKVRIAHAGGMEIIVDIHPGEDGRPEGTVRAADSSEARSFSGNLEFIALVERLYRADDASETSTRHSMKGNDNV
jgi:hypothetical protein